jgi:hypothetical protein
VCYYVGVDAEQFAVMHWRVEALEKRVDQDHEPRLRKVEAMASKVAVFAAIGASLGGAMVSAVLHWLISQ